MASAIDRLKDFLAAPEETKTLIDEYKKKYLQDESTPGENILYALDKLGDFLNKEGIQPGKKHSKEQKAKMRKTVKFIGDMLPHTPQEALLFVPGATLAQQAVKQTVARASGSAIRQRAFASIGRDVVSGRGVIRTPSGNLRDFKNTYDEIYSYSSGLINKIRTVRKEFDKMSSSNISIKKLKLFKRNLSPGGASEKGYKKLGAYDEGIPKVSFEKNFEGAFRGRLDFTMQVKVVEENSINIMLRDIGKDGWVGNARLKYQLTKLKGDKGYKIDNVYFFADNQVGRRKAHMLGMQLLDQVPKNTFIEEGILTMDSLFYLLKNALRAPEGKQLISKAKVQEFSFSQGRRVASPSKFSEASKLSDKGDFVGLVDLVRKTEADLIKRGKMKGKVDQKGRVLESELDFEVGHKPGGGLFLKYNHFTVTQLKSIIAGIAGYQTWDGFKRASDRQDKIDQKAS